jgi:DNA-binding CsgD family transcriptional regulator
MRTSTITDPDLRRMLAIVEYDDSSDGSTDGSTDGKADGDALPWGLVHLLKELVECDALVVAGQDTPTWTFFSDQALPRQRFAPDVEAALDAAYREHYWSSTCSYPDRTGDIARVTRDSDLACDRDYRNSGMYADYDRVSGVEHEVRVCLDAGSPQRTLRLLFVRGPGLDFTDRDVAVLTVLRPHLQAAFAAAERRRRCPSSLTARQREILRYVAAGYTNGQISRRLEVSEATVRKHLENSFARLGASSRTAAVARLEPAL